MLLEQVVSQRLPSSAEQARPEAGVAMTGWNQRRHRPGISLGENRIHGVRRGEAGVLLDPLRMVETQTRALEAAVHLLGTEGLRALTHARVDERAGLPPGSTSSYFRTRAALVAGVGDWIIETELTQVGAVAITPRSAADLVEVMCGLVGPNRTLTAARLTVFMEAYLVETLTRLGAAVPETAALTLMACAEGIILHRIARHDEADPRPVFALVVAAALP